MFDCRIIPCRATLPIIAALLLSAGSVRAQEAPETKPTKLAPTEKDVTKARERAAMLFAPNEPLEFTLTSDFRSAFKSRDTLNVKSTKATITMRDTSGTEVTFPLEIEPRGHFRLQKLHCNIPPIRLEFTEPGKKGTAFAGQDKLKLGTHCRSNFKEYDEIPLREYIIYRIYNLITPLSFQARVARVTYVDATGKDDPQVKWGILLEDDDEMAARNGGLIREIRGARFSDVDAEQLLLSLLFEYVIGGHDWSLYSLHNIRLVQMPDFRYFPVPYDWDFSGLAKTSYSGPPPQVPIREVQDRYYRGPCVSDEALRAALQKFHAQRTNILALYDSVPGISDDYLKFAREYMRKFFDDTEDFNEAKQDIMRSCTTKPSA
jgi:hypothetical protein